ncbi:MAG: hypothetical protein IT372_41200 [Polyangiaceae bacterium]|nr:hypothetical protein [Polyangiaceae bacterium]
MSDKRGVLICLAGVSGAGKDTAGDHLVRAHGFTRVALADPIKAAVMALFQLGAAELWGDARDAPDPALGVAPREIYQRFGQACAALDPEVWIRPFRLRVGALLAAGGRVVCTDLRTSAELRAARDMGGIVWRIDRPGAGAPGRLGEHATETDVARRAPADFDAVILNDGSREALTDHLSRALASIQ